MKYILAEDYRGKFVPREVSDSKRNVLENIEYVDVATGGYQVWEYPSGSIFKISPDRQVDREYTYSMPSEEVWMPKLTLLGANKQLVSEAYLKLTDANAKKPVMTRLFSRFIKKK